MLVFVLGLLLLQNPNGPAYAIRFDGDALGPNLRPCARHASGIIPGPCMPPAAPGRRVLFARTGTMEELAEEFGRQFGYLVVDETGLEGTYRWTVTQLVSDSPRFLSEPKNPDFPTMVHEQLGLRLERIR